YLSNPLEILFVWKGGLASHGGALGIIGAIWWFCRKQKFKFVELADRVSLTVPLAGGLVRLGNLMNSEIVGKPTDVSWAFIFTRVDEVPRHPAQLYEALCYFVTFGLLMLFYKKLRKIPHGSIL